MLLAKVVNNEVKEIKYHWEFGLKQPPTNEYLQEIGLMRVNTYRPFDPKTHKLVSCEPVVEGDWVYNVEVAELTQEEKDTFNEIAMLQLRKTRNDLLSSCDWTMLEDAPISQEVKAQWVQYRQQLRDFPSTIEDCNDPVNWPSRPV